MLIAVAPVLMDFDGNPIMQPDGVTKWTVGLVLITAALGGPAQGQSFDETEQVARYMLAADLRDAMRSLTDGMEESHVEIAPDMANKLKGNIARTFGPIIAGQVIQLLSRPTP